MLFFRIATEQRHSGFCTYTSAGPSLLHTQKNNKYQIPKCPQRDQDQYWRFISARQENLELQPWGGVAWVVVSRIYSLKSSFFGDFARNQRRVKTKQSKDWNQLATAVDMREWVRKRKASSDLLHDKKKKLKSIRETSTIAIGNLPRSQLLLMSSKL